VDLYRSELNGGSLDDAAEGVGAVIHDESRGERPKFNSSATATK
jgi:hypothetical protein